MQQSAYTPVEFTDLAEGLPNAYDVEPASPLKTTTIPVVVNDTEKDAPPSETGMVATAYVNAEGRDNGDAQDASHRSGETQAMPMLDKVMSVKRNDPPVILIVEDTTELAEIIQATLERMNMVTIHETHGIKALAKFNEMSPDVVLLDISLPDMTGWKILDAIKERQEQVGNIGRMPVVIVITAYGDPANRLVGKLQGVYSYLIKPFTSDEIEAVVSQALNSPTR
ncbi:MAG: response regulator [Chitinophagaceae bacterium]|nr:response regulator [Anaerolineae bacterium]